MQMASLSVVVLLTLLLWPALGAVCGTSGPSLLDPSYVASLLLYQPLTQGSTLMSDPVAGHQMTHSQNTVYDSNGIVYSNSVTKLVSDSSAAFKFPPLFVMSLYAKTTWTQTAMNYEMIFAKKTGTGVFLELLVQSFNMVNTLILRTAAGQVSIGPWSLNTFHRVVLAYTGTRFEAYLDGALLQTVVASNSDVLNGEMYIGQDSDGTSSLLNGQVRDLTMWSDTNMITNFPAGASIGTLCADALYHTSQFDIGSDYYWPNAAAFGTGWFHVRRLMPNSWLHLYDNSGAVCSDLLSGNAVSLSLEEIMAYEPIKSQLVLSFENRNVTTDTQRAYNRYFAPWNVQEYLIVAGDHTSWIRFSKAELAAGVTSANGLTVFPAVVPMSVTNSSGSPTTYATKTVYMKGVSDLFIGVCNTLSCGVSAFSNDSAGPIYGETTTWPYVGPLNNLYVHNGSNVFVRLLSADYPKCGDSFRTYPEECDDGNTASGDGCSSECKVEIGYSCTGGSYNNSAVDICSIYSLCGDGIVTGTEDCDDSNTANGDGYLLTKSKSLPRCSSACKLEANIPVIRYTQGPATVLFKDPATGATFLPSVASITNTNMAGYWAARVRPSYAGSSVPWVGYATRSYTYTAMLNDGYKTASENCDDGNTVAGDGCHNGMIEAGWTCTEDASKKSSCALVTTPVAKVTFYCGDGLLTDDEECDPPGEGCSFFCKVISGFYAVTTQVMLNGTRRATAKKCNVACNTCTAGSDANCIECAAGYVRIGSVCILPIPTPVVTPMENKTEPADNSTSNPRTESEPARKRATADESIVSSMAEAKYGPLMNKPLNSTATVVIVGATVIAPNIGIQSLFSLLEIMQFLSLFSLINVQYTSSVLVSYYKSLSLSTFEFLPNVFDYIIPDDENPTKDPDNEFTDNFQLHPSLSGKNFLFNIGNTLTMFAITVGLYLLLLAASRLFDKCEKMRKQYEHSGISCTLAVSFLEIFLSACVQLKYVPICRLITDPQPDYASNNWFCVVSTCVGAVCAVLEVFFLTKLGIFYYETQFHLKEEDYVELYSGLVEEYGTISVGRFTPIMMLLRVAFAVPLLVIMKDYPVIQASGFLVYNVAIFIWFIFLRPAKEKLRNVLVCLRESIIVSISCLYLVMALNAGDPDLYGSIIVIGMFSVYGLEILAGLIDTLSFVIEFLRSCCAPTKPTELSAPEIKVHPAQEAEPVESYSANRCKVPSSAFPHRQMAWLLRPNQLLDSRRTQDSASDASPPLPASEGLGSESVMGGQETAGDSVCPFGRPSSSSRILEKFQLI